MKVFDGFVKHFGIDPAMILMRLCVVGALDVSQLVSSLLLPKCKLVTATPTVPFGMTDNDQTIREILQSASVLLLAVVFHQTVVLIRNMLGFYLVSTPNEGFSDYLYGVRVRCLGPIQALLVWSIVSILPLPTIFPHGLGWGLGILPNPEVSDCCSHPGLSAPWLAKHSGNHVFGQTKGDQGIRSETREMKRQHWRGHLWHQELISAQVRQHLHARKDEAEDGALR